MSTFISLQILRKLTETVSVCVSVYVCVCVCVCVCSMSLASDSSETVDVLVKHGDCLSYENARRVNYIGLDLH